MKIKKPNLRLHLSTAQWWLFSIAAVLSLTAVLAAHAVFLFIRAASADVVTGDTEIVVESISREGLKEAVRDFTARTARFENIKANYEGVGDPSL